MRPWVRHPVIEACVCTSAAIPYDQLLMIVGTEGSTPGPLRRRWRLLAALALVIVLAGLGLWWSNRDSGPGKAAPASEAAIGLSRFPQAQRLPLPMVRGTLLDGSALSLAQYRGHVVVLNLWGSWCAPCRAEAPDLVKVANATKADGVRFVGIDTRDEPSAAAAFVRRFHVPYPSFNDRDGRVLSRFSGIVPISGVPSTVVVDKRGRVAARVVGRVDAKTLRGLITDLLPASAPSS